MKGIIGVNQRKKKGIIVMKFKRYSTVRSKVLQTISPIFSFPLSLLSLLIQKRILNSGDWA